MVDVFAWPPVAVVARYWTMEQPIGRSRSLITGASYVSAVQRRRILAGFEVAGWPKYGAGYLEALWRLLDGGVHLVRLSSCRIPYGRTVPNAQRGAQRIGWTAPPAPVQWITPPSPLEWFDGAILAGELITSGSFPAVRITGLPSASLVALPGEFLVVHLRDGDETHMIAREVRSDGAGIAVARLITQPSQAGHVSLGGRETGVFEIVSDWPKVMNRLRFPDGYGLEFRQVFADERGPFVERDPWR